MSSVLDYIKHYQKNIERCSGDEKRVLRCIEKLDKLPVTVQHLQDTGVGRTVNALRKEHGEIGKASKALVAKWKLMVAEEEESEEEELQHEEDDQDSVNEIDQRDHNSHSTHQDMKRKYEEKPNDHNKRSRTDTLDSSEKRQRSDSDASENVQRKSSRNSCESDSNHSEKYSNHVTDENDDDSDMENKYTNYKHEKTKHKYSENENSQKSKSSHHSTKDKNNYKGKHSISESPKDKHSSKSSKEKSDKKDDKNSSSGRHKHSEEYKQSSENRSDNRNSSSSSSKSHSDSKKNKDATNSNNTKLEDKKHSSKSRDKESKTKDVKSSSSSKREGSKTENKSHKEHVVKHKSSDKKETPSKKSSKEEHSKRDKSSETAVDDGIDCESGASFAEALGMISHSPTKKKPSRETHNKSLDMKKSEIKSPTEQPKLDTKPSSSSKVDTSLLNPDFKLEPLPPLEISALPEISPNYKPRPPPKLLNSFHSEEEALKSVMLNKNQRTKVYSGNKIYGAVPSLYELCVIILQENIDALEYTGGVPYDILKPVVDKSTPDQLFMLEHYNPYLMDDTDPLWQKHCEKRFRTQKRQELETWREMYMRCLDEQEEKLKSLTANIKMSQDLKKAPTRVTKMAYVDSVVKPPRGIARKQAIYGTAKIPVVSPAARVAALATGNVVKAPDSVKSVPSSSDHAPRSSGFIKPKKAPLMQKALQLMKGRHKR